MNVNRREFIKTTSAAALATAFPLSSFAETLLSEETTYKPRLIILREPDFPSGEIQFPAQEEIVSALKDVDIRFSSAKEIQEQLSVETTNVVINPYGSRFPVELWGKLIAYFKSGGNFINLGGTPFSIPVLRYGNTWKEELPQTAFHKKLGITQSFPVQTLGTKQEKIIDLEYDAELVYELYLRLTETKDFPNEDGPAGARDANVKALSFLISQEGRKIAAPIIEIDHVQGDYSGGRWLLANFKGKMSAKSIRELVLRAVFGASALSAHSSFACYYEREIPTLTMQLRRPAGQIEKFLSGNCELDIVNEKGKRIEHVPVSLKGEGTLVTANFTSSTSSFHPGLYTVSVKQKIQIPNSSFSETLIYKTGFWIYDRKLLEGGKPFTTNETYLLRDNQPYPVTGTTYMGSDVHRKFLFEPNVAIWEVDFASMKSSGINMVRTGIWTAWKNYMLDVGSPNEIPLRAMDAFIHTARKYDIPVILTLFAFLLETWGGENPYLDPRSINAQKEFISAFASRYSFVNDVIWDFINEPSFCNPQQLWSCRPNYDKYEAAAWNDWLKQRYPANSDDERISRLQEVYRTADDPTSLPALEEFDDVNIFNDHHPVKVIDYRLFAQDMFIRWTKEMTKAIRNSDNAQQLITVGQDEGGTYERPSPQFYSDAVDITSIHNWWYNEDLLWDSIITKAPGKPNLVEETGVMFYEKTDSAPWRTEQQAANLLERKLAVSLGSGGAGFIEWIWNTNPYMKSDNEAAIGLHRVDDTAKPELESVITFAKFFKENSRLMIGKKPEDVVMVIPHSQMFSTRNFATEATQKCVRTMIQRCRVSMSAVSEYHLEKITSVPKLIIVPSPRTLNEQAWSSLVKFANDGATVLLSGSFDMDDHWMPVQRSRQLGFSAKISPVMEEEQIRIDGKEYHISYRGSKIERIEKAILDDSQPTLKVIQQGKGSIVWSPLPIEISDNEEPIEAYYNYALKQARIQSPFVLQNDQPSVLLLPLEYSDVVLITGISFGDSDSEFDINYASITPILHLTIPAQRTTMMLVRKRDGQIISQLIH